MKLLFYALPANESEYSSISKDQLTLSTLSLRWSNSQKNWYCPLNSGLEFYQKYQQISQSWLSIVNSHCTTIWSCVYYVFMTVYCNKTQFINLTRNKSYTWIGYNLLEYVFSVKTIKLLYTIYLLYEADK